MLDLLWSVVRLCALLAEHQSQSEKNWILVQREYCFGENFVSCLTVNFWGHILLLPTTGTSWPSLDVVAARVAQTKIRGSSIGNWKENFWRLLNVHTPLPSRTLYVAVRCL